MRGEEVRRWVSRGERGRGWRGAWVAREGRERSAAGGKASPISPADGGLSRDRPFFAKNKPDTLVFTARTRGETGSKVFLQQANAADAKLVYRDEGNAWMNDVCADGSRVLLVRRKTFSEAVVLEVDTAKGAARRIFPEEGKSAYVAQVVYLPGDKHALIATDDGVESRCPF